MDEKLSDKLQVGVKIKIGKEYANKSRFKEGEVIELIEGWFEVDNGLYCSSVSCPSIKIDNEYDDDFDSIFHLFGNELDGFMDCEVINE